MSQHRGGYFSSRILLKRWKDHMPFLSSSLKLRENSWASGKHCFFGPFHTQRKMDDLRLSIFQRLEMFFFLVSLLCIWRTWGIHAFEETALDPDAGLQRLCPLYSLCVSSPQWPFWSQGEGTLFEHLPASLKKIASMESLSVKQERWLLERIQYSSEAGLGWSLAEFHRTGSILLFPVPGGIILFSELISWSHTLLS